MLTTDLIKLCPLTENFSLVEWNLNNIGMLGCGWVNLLITLFEVWLGQKGEITTSIWGLNLLSAQTVPRLKVKYSVSFVPTMFQKALLQQNWCTCTCIVGLLSSFIFWQIYLKKKKKKKKNYFQVKKKKIIN